MSATTTTGRRRSGRLLLAGTALLAAASLVVGVPSLAGAASTTSRSDAAAGWLGRQLTDDHVVTGQFGADYGLTADVVLALDSAKVGRRAARHATHALRRHLLDYTGFGDSSEFYAGSFAKLLNVAAAQHADPRHFGGSARHNLVAQLRRLECGTPARPSCPAADRGRFSDRSTYGDYSNTLTQSLALLGLDRTTRTGPSRASVVYLRRQQCAGGAFPLEISTAGCHASVDATGFAVQALLATGKRKARAAAMHGARWLKRHQAGNGSFSGNGTRNSNTTALAAQALRAAGRDAAADHAVSFIRSLQFGCGAKASNRGKVRYDRANSGDPLRATAQAVPALAGVGLADIAKAGGSLGLPTLRCS